MVKTLIIEKFFSRKIGETNEMAWLLSCLLIIFLLSGCAAPSEVRRIIQDNNRLKSDFYSLRQEVGELKKSVKSLEALSSKPVPKDVLEAIRNSQVKIHDQVTELTRNLQHLQGMTNENKYATEREIKDNEKKRAFLMAKIEEVGGEIEGLMSRISSIEEKISKPEKGVTERQKTGNPPLSLKQQGLPQTPEEIYQDAVDVLREGKYSEARSLFEKFQKENPGSELADNAQFWIAESYYKEGNFEEAILAYDTLIKEFRGSDKVPNAMLKQAYSFLELDEKDATKGILNSLKEKFPNTKEAELAEIKLQELAKKVKK